MVERARLVVGIAGSWLALALAVLLSIPSLVGERTCVDATTTALSLTGLDCRHFVPLPGYSEDVEADGSMHSGPCMESRCWSQTVSVCMALEHPLRKLR